MAGSKIEWTDRVWNPVTGCDRTSPGCDNCYALTMARRLKAMGQAKYQRDGDPRTSGPGFGVTVHADVLGEPFRWRKPSVVFVNSMSDLFHPDVPSGFIKDVWTTMAATPRHTYQVLTKRARRMQRIVGDPTFDHDIELRLQEAGCTDDVDWLDVRYPFGGTKWLPNVWLGTSIENDRYTFRADHLRATPAAVRFLSLEPLLGPLPSLDLDGIGWVIAGGESGPGARPMNPDWVRDIRDRCAAAGVPFFFKQWGSWVHVDQAPDETVQRIDAAHNLAGNPQTVFNVGKALAGRELDGRTHDDMPQILTKETTR